MFFHEICLVVSSGSPDEGLSRSLRETSKEYQLRSVGLARTLRENVWTRSSIASSAPSTLRAAALGQRVQPERAFFLSESRDRGAQDSAICGVFAEYRLVNEWPKSTERQIRCELDLRLLAASDTGERSHCTSHSQRRNHGTRALRTRRPTPVCAGSRVYGSPPRFRVPSGGCRQRSLHAEAEKPSRRG